MICGTVRGKPHPLSIGAVPSSVASVTWRINKCLPRRPLIPIRLSMGASGLCLRRPHERDDRPSKRRRLRFAVDRGRIGLQLAFGLGHVARGWHALGSADGWDDPWRRKHPNDPIDKRMGILDPSGMSSQYKLPICCWVHREWCGFARMGQSVLRHTQRLAGDGRILHLP